MYFTMQACIGSWSDPPPPDCDPRCCYYCPLLPFFNSKYYYLNNSQVGMRSYAIKFDIFRKMPKDLTEATYSGALCMMVTSSSV